MLFITVKSLSLEYNINGIGVITPVIYPFANKLYSDKDLEIELRLKNINQLGTIKFLHNGAHYTRYEYLLLQFMLINFIKKHSELGLGSEFNFSVLEIKENLNYKKKISGGEILELIVLFGNMGHFKDTFSSNKVWFHYLYTNKNNLKSSLKRGMKKESNRLLECLLEKGETHKIQWINTLFILSRSERFNDYRIICEQIFDKLLSKSTNKWLDIYHKVRKISYVTLDSHFSHIPISISLQNVLFNEKLFIDEISKYHSGLIGTFDRMADLLEDTLYLENNALLMNTYRSMDIEGKLNQFLERKHVEKDIAKIDMIIRNEESSPFYQNFEILQREIPWNMNKNLSITYSVKHREKFPTDVFQIEKNISKKLGRNCYISFNFSPNFTKYRTVYSINKNLERSETFKECLKIIRVAIDDYELYKKHSNESVNNGPLNEVVMKKVFTYLFRNLLVEEYFCEYEYTQDMSPFIIATGSKTIIRHLDKYISKYCMLYPNEKDSIHELKTIKVSLESMDYRGLIIVYLGSLKFRDNEKKSICEVDGLIFTPKHPNILIRIIEAKNTRKKMRRANEAAKQLEEQFESLLPEYIYDKKQMKEISGYGAQVIIKS